MLSFSSLHKNIHLCGFYCLVLLLIRFITMKNYVLCFGEVLWDTFADGKTPGGAPMNVACHLVQQDVDVLFATRLGDDKPGRKLRAFLKENQLDGPHVQTDGKLPTCEVTVQLDADSQATYIIPEPVSWDKIKVKNGIKKAARKASAIIYGSLASRGEITRQTLLTLLDESSALKIFDLNLRAPHYQIDTIETLAAKADVIKMNEDEAELMMPGYQDNLHAAISELQKKFHIKTVCITRGGKGAIICHDEHLYEHPGYTVQVEDTVGAGDSFLATLVSGLLKEKPMAEVLEKACAIGAFVASKRGANPPYDKDAIKAIKGGVAA